MNSFSFRHTNPEDLDALLKIYSHARIFMAENGNPTQWSTNWPPDELIKADIDNNINYVCTYNNEIVGVFAYMQGIDIDPTYRIIENGNWIGDGEYGVVHRLASSGTIKGVGKACLDFAYSKCKHLRVDTHNDNKVMQNLLIKNGFTRCGIIYVEKDNSPRIAYEKI